MANNKYYADVPEAQMQTEKFAMGLMLWADTGRLVEGESFMNEAGCPCLCETFTDPISFGVFNGVHGHHVIVDLTPEQLLPNRRSKEQHERNFRHAHLLEDMAMTTIAPETFERLRGAISTENWGTRYGRRILSKA